MRLKDEAHVRLSSERKCAKTLYVDKIKRIPTKMSKFSCSCDNLNKRTVKNDEGDATRKDQCQLGVVR
jgi:hypothetical protein